MSGSVDDGTLLIVGGGRMGEALLGGLLAAGRPAGELVVAEVSPSRRQELAAAHPGVVVVETVVPAVAAVLAVKPAEVADAARAVAAAGARRVLSVAAGVTTEAIEAAAERRLAVVRDAEHAGADRRGRGCDQPRIGSRRGGLGVGRGGAWGGRGGRAGTGDGA